MALAAPSIDEAYALEDRYRKERGRVLLTGTQALVRLPLMQRRRDARARAATPPASSAATAARRSAWSTRQLWKAQKLLEAAGRPLPPRHQRGAGGDRRARHAAGRGRSTSARRRRVRHVVRQGPGRGPRGRRAQARQRLRRVAARRRAGRRGDDHGCVSSSMPHQSDQALRRLAHAGAAPGQRRRVPRVRPVRLGAVALLGQLGRLHGALGGGRERRQAFDLPDAAAASFATARPASRARRTACTTAGPTCPR